MESKRAYRDAPGSGIKLPKEVYYRCVWIVRDRSRLERLAAVTDGNGDSAWTEESADAVSMVSEAAVQQSCAACCTAASDTMDTASALSSVQV